MVGSPCSSFYAILFIFRVLCSAIMNMIYGFYLKKKLLRVSILWKGIFMYDCSVSKAKLNEYSEKIEALALELTAPQVLVINFPLFFQKK